MATESPLIVIAGPTGSGKTAVAIELAQRFNGEIICADSRTIYKDMDIGTAKPTPKEQATVVHWGIDLVNPGERYTAADFKRYALKKIEEIRARGKVPLLVGGTGLYIDSIIFDYRFDGALDITRRAQLSAMSLEELLEHCHKHNIKLPENSTNKRYVIRTIERQGGGLGSRSTPIDNVIIVGIATDMLRLRQRLSVRTELLFDNGVVDEARILGKKYGWTNEAMTGNIYPLVKAYLDGERSLEATKKQFTTRDYQLAKRQMTWFRRNPSLMWCQYSEVATYIAQRLASE